MYFASLGFLFLLLTTVKCTQQLSCNSYQKDGDTFYRLSDPEGVLSAEPDDCDVSFELKNGTNIANLHGTKLPCVKHFTSDFLISTNCYPHLLITRACTSEKELFEVPCYINCQETTPPTVDQSPKSTPSTLHQRHYLWILLSIGLLVAIIVALVLLYIKNKNRSYMDVKTADEGSQAS